MFIPPLRDLILLHVADLLDGKADSSPGAFMSYLLWIEKELYRRPMVGERAPVRSQRITRELQKKMVAARWASNLSCQQIAVVFNVTAGRVSEAMHLYNAHGDAFDDVPDDDD